MATIKKKVKKAQDGLCNWSDKRGGGVSCGRRGGPKGDTYKPGKMPKWTKKEERYAEAEASGDALMKAGKRDKLMSTAPGLRSSEERNRYKKGSESFFGGEKDTTAAKYGKKVAKKSSVKKAKVGAKVKSIKKSAKKK